MKHKVDSIIFLHLKRSPRNFFKTTSNLRCLKFDNNTSKCLEVSLREEKVMYGDYPKRKEKINTDCKGWQANSMRRNFSCLIIELNLTRCIGQETFFKMDFHGKLIEFLKGTLLLAAICVWYSLLLSLAYEIWSSLSWLLSSLKGKMHIGQMFYGNLHKKWWQRAINSSLLWGEMLLCS